MTVTVVRYRTKADRADENAALVEQVFAQLHADAPSGLQYMTLRLADGVSFVHVAVVETDDGSNPLTTTAAFEAFQREVSDRCEEGPVAVKATVVGAYGFPLDPTSSVAH
jgi:hypothetical protein